MKASKILLNITSAACFVYFALYLASLVFIPIGIYCYLAGKKFAFKAENLNDQFRFSNREFKYYVIFVSIFCFPFGLLAIYPYMQLASNNVSISTVNEPKFETESTTYEEVVKPTEVVQETNVETDEEKWEKFKKLESFRKKGFITEEDLEQAREQLFGHKDN